MIAEYKDADDDIVRWQSADGTVKTAHINDLILAYETKRGKWIPNSPFTGNCSECGGKGNLKDNYCSTCGARMEGE